jgi:N-acetylglutamate synthase-like GNAT family acetyltransferase
MMAAIVVRRARDSDAAALQALYQALVPGDPNIRVRSERIAQIERDSYNFLLVVEVDGEVCGTAFLTICLDPMYDCQPYGVVENVIVSPSVRGRGAGRALSNGIDDIARAAHCTKLMLLSSAVRREAHAFFSRMGFDGDKKRGFVKYLNR